MYVSGIVTRPRKVDNNIPWFEGFTERQHKRAYQTISNAVQNAPSMSDVQKEAQANQGKEFFKQTRRILWLDPIDLLLFVFLNKFKLLH